MPNENIVYNNLLFVCNNKPIVDIIKYNDYVNFILIFLLIFVIYNLLTDTVIRNIIIKLLDANMFISNPNLLKLFNLIKTF